VENALVGHAWEGMEDMLVRDEHTWSWYVLKGDPSWPFVSHLVRLGFRTIVLPRQAIISGEAPISDVGRLHSLAATYRQLERLNDPSSSQLASRFLHESLLYECCAAAASMT